MSHGRGARERRTARYWASRAVDAAAELVELGWARTEDEAVEAAGGWMEHPMTVAKRLERAAWRVRKLETLAEACGVSLEEAGVTLPTLRDLAGRGQTWREAVASLVHRLAGILLAESAQVPHRHHHRLPWRLHDGRRRPVRAGTVDEARLQQLRREREELWRLRDEAAVLDWWADDPVRQLLALLIRMRHYRTDEMADDVAALVAAEEECITAWIQKEEKRGERFAKRLARREKAGARVDR